MSCCVIYVHFHDLFVSCQRNFYVMFVLCCRCQRTNSLVMCVNSYVFVMSLLCNFLCNVCLFMIVSSWLILVICVSFCAMFVLFVCLLCLLCHFLVIVLCLVYVVYNHMDPGSRRQHRHHRDHGGSSKSRHPSLRTLQGYRADHRESESRRWR